MTEYVPKLTETGRPLPEPGLRAQLMRIRYDLTAAQGKLTEAIRMYDELGIDEVTRTSFMNGPVTADQCPECGVGHGGHTADHATMLECACPHPAQCATAKECLTGPHKPAQEPT